jgi:hypothetical protein
MTGYRGLVAEALAATRVVSATSHEWFGVRSQGLSEEAEALMGPASGRDYLVYNLQARLYADFYCAGRARPPLDDPSWDPLPGQSPFVHALSAANAGTSAREPGWAVVGEGAGLLVVARGGLSLWLPATEVYPASGAGVVVGAHVGVRMPKELLRLSPGFYMALGDAEFPADGSAPLVRFYWNLRSDGAVPLVAQLTRRMNAEGLAFRLKVVSDPLRYSRCDAGVLYTRQDQYQQVCPIVSDVYRSAGIALNPMTPALTKQLAPGLALAEDPGDPAASFGLSRCLLLAAGIVRSAEIGVCDDAQRLKVIEERFAEDGIDLDVPYLNPGSMDRYHFPL